MLKKKKAKPVVKIDGQIQVNEHNAYQPIAEAR